MPALKGILYVALLIFAMWLLYWTGYFFCWIYDSSFLPEKQTHGVITDKKWSDGYYQTTYIYSSNNTMIPMMTYIDPSYYIYITIDGLVDDVSINKRSWIYLEVGDSLCCNYTNGRIWKSMYVKSFCK